MMAPSGRTVGRLIRNILERNDGGIRGRTPNRGLLPLRPLIIGTVALSAVH